MADGFAVELDLAGTAAAGWQGGGNETAAMVIRYRGSPAKEVFYSIGR